MPACTVYVYACVRPSACIGEQARRANKHAKGHFGPSALCHLLILARVLVANVFAGLGYALLSDVVAEATSEAGSGCAGSGAHQVDPVGAWHCALSSLNVDDCKDAAHAALSVFLHSVLDPDTDVVARIVERWRPRPFGLLCFAPPACVPSDAGFLPGCYTGC